MEIKEGFTDQQIQLFFTAINETSMKRPDFNKFLKAYQSRDVILSFWENETLVAFGSMLTDWTMNSIIYDVVVTAAFQKKGYGKMIMEELMKRAPETRFYLTSTFGNEEFYKKLGFKKHKTAFALYQTQSPYLEE